MLLDHLLLASSYWTICTVTVIGMQRRENIAGTRIGRRPVVETVENRPNGRRSLYQGHLIAVLSRRASQTASTKDSGFEEALHIVPKQDVPELRFLA
ncbi:hypothetical protein AOG23_27115 [Rhizobium acidisoli]|nr:hypothetical protein AOG23_27115 [Rhizobium acidisoli]